MNKALSQYLDLSRFLAAFLVMLCHFSDSFVIGFAPFFVHLGAEGVGVFFVLSGFVIAYVTDTREPTLKTYAINRIARIYSVVLPCLAATFLLDSLGQHFMPHYYAASWPALSPPRWELLKAFLSLAFLNDIWLSYWFPGSDSPFWSLCYEVPYYLIFAAAKFLAGRTRWVVLGLACLLYGPAIIALFPLWLTGYAAYRWQLRHQPGIAAGRAIFLAALAFWAGCEALRWKFSIGIGKCNGMYSPDGWQYYAAGLPFAASIIGMRFSGLVQPGWFARPFRWLSGATFTLYLLHYPLSRFLNGLLAPGLGNLPRWITLIILTLTITLPFAAITERRRIPWRRSIQTGWNRIGLPG